jgi:hypothetical protein
VSEPAWVFKFDQIRGAHCMMEANEAGDLEGVRIHDLRHAHASVGAGAVSGCH